MNISTLKDRRLEDLGIEEKRRLLAHLLREQEGDSGEEGARSPAEPEPIAADPSASHLPFPLTDIQQAYWVGRGSDGETGGVSCYAYLEREVEDLDLERLERALRELVERHDMLRAVFLPDGRQLVLPRVPAYRVQVTDLAELDARDPESARRRLEAIRAAMSHQVLPAERWPLFQVRATRLSRGRSVLHFGFDLLIADAWSIRLLLGELTTLYRDPDAELPPIGIGFRDYVLAEEESAGRQRSDSSRTYWLDRLDELPPAPELPLAAAPDGLDAIRFVRREGQLAPGAWARLRDRARSAGITPSAVLMAAFAEVLATWSKGPRFSINTTLFNRRPIHPDVNRVVGDFTSSLLVGLDWSSGATFEQRARGLQEQLWADLSHRHFSGVRLLRELARRQNSRDMAAMPVVFTSMLYGDRGLRADEGAEILGTPGFGISQTPQVWLDHQVHERAGALVFNWDTVDDLFPEGMLDDMFAAYRRLLDGLAASDGALWSSDRPSLLPARQLEVRAAVNATESPRPEGLLQEGFLRQVEERPGATAVVSPAETLTYEALRRRSNGLAHLLQARRGEPFGADELVAMVLPKGAGQVVAALGALEAGAAYLPIDPAFPEERRNHLLAAGNVRVAVTSSELARTLDWPAGVETVAVDGSAARDWDSREVQPLDSSQTPSDLAYVIFTSGSTGTPKGVAIEHGAALNTIVDINRRFGVGPEDRVLGLSSMTFDLSVWDVFGILGAGGTLVLPDPELRGDPAHWIELMAEHRVTVWNSVPALMGLLVDALPEQEGRVPDGLRLALLSGDWIPVSLPGRIERAFPGARVISLGGATEASIWSIFHAIDRVEPEWTSIPYGRPLANQRFHVLDERLEPCPDWVPGQLYIAGDGLARCYWGDEDLTRGSFFDHPRTGERLYRTGDLGRYLPDGEIEFLGREDFQVKVNGYRIELGEIEAALGDHPEVGDAVALVRGEDEQHRRLAAYVVPAKEGNGASEGPTAPPDWHAMVRGAAAEAERSALEPEALERTVEVLERISTRLMASALDDLGAFAEAGETWTVDRLISERGVLPRYRKLLGQWLEALAADGLLERTASAAPVGDAGYRAPRPLGSAADAPMEELWEAARRQGLIGDRFLDYLGVCGESHVDLLTGAVDPLELFFPQGSWEVAEGLYELSPLSHAVNVMAREAIRAASEAWTGERPLRILEVGAGTGGTTSSLLPALDPERTVYHFTDLSRFFTEQAAEKFRDYPFLRFGLLDIDRDPAEQGFQAGSFDLIVAANVLHDAHFLGDTMDRLRSLLRPGGALVALEATRNTRVQMVSVGFIEGFSNFEDERAEENLPLLSVAKWRDLVCRHGFEELSALPEPRGGHRSIEHVMIARADDTVPERSGRGATIDEAELLRHLRSKLPEYMVPTAIVPLDALPLTHQGKVDRKALPDPLADEHPPSAEFVAPAGELEAQIAAIWQDVLGVERIGVHDNFFELGGDSVFMTKVAGRLRSSLDRQIPLAELFRCPTVASLAKRLSAGGGASGGLSGGSSGDGAERERATRERVEARKAARRRRRRSGGRRGGREDHHDAS